MHTTIYYYYSNIYIVRSQGGDPPLTSPTLKKKIFYKSSEKSGGDPPLTSMTLKINVSSLDTLIIQHLLS